jgi:hypothetical protein
MQMLYFGCPTPPYSQVSTCKIIASFRRSALPQPVDDELVDGPHVVQLSEDASLLSNLVSLLYPTHWQRRVKPGSCEKVFALLAACQKYNMLLIQQEIRDKIDLERFPTPHKAQAFSAYAIASSWDPYRKWRMHSSHPRLTYDIQIPWGRVIVIQRAGSTRTHSPSYSN